MLVEIHSQLEVITGMEAYDPERGYEIAALVWYHGFGDFRTEHKHDYGMHLANLIADLRADLKIPNLPVVVGGAGWFGMR